MKNSTFKGSQLRTARQLRGMTITSLAEKSNITKQAISQYENGLTEPEFSNGTSLAYCLDIPYSFFFVENPCKASSGTTYFRSLASTPKNERIRQKVKLECVAKMREALMNYVDFPELRLPNVIFNGTDSIFDITEDQKELNEIETIASKLRDAWNLGDGPITNLQHYVEANGIVLTGFATGSKGIDAFSQRITLESDKNFFYAVAIALDSTPEGRVNFDIAHELGHILLHPWGEDIDSISHSEFRSRERQANRFAGAFLMPRNSFGRDVSYYGTDLKHYEKLKRKWKVSIQAMIVRSRQIEAITANQYQYMFRKISASGNRKNEPGDYPFELNANVFQGAIDLLKANNYRVNHLMDLFSNYGVGFFPEEIEEMLHLVKGTLKEESVNRNIVRLKNW